MTNIERLIERLYESKPDKEEYDMKKIINPWKDMEATIVSVALLTMKPV